MGEVLTELQLENKLIDHLAEFDRYEINNKIKNTDQLLDYIVEETIRRNPNSFDDELIENQKEELRFKLMDGDVFTKAKFIRNGYQFASKDNVVLPVIKFIDFDDYTNNKYEIVNQLEVNSGGFKNRFDVVLLINGFPIVHIELKKSGIDLHEAIHQLGRYHNQSSTKGIMEYTQFYIVSNQVDTYYIANQSQKLNKEFMISWSDKNNHKIGNLLSQEDTTTCVVNEMLNTKMLILLLSDYFLLDEENRSLIILRPYQINAVRAMLDKVDNYKKGIDYRKNSGYIYHATGSGKTLTSFTTAKLVSKNPNIKKVIFVVDRIDLADQTKKEYNRYGKGLFDVPNVHHTGQLITALNSSNKIIVTTVQKLDKALQKFQEDNKLDKNDLANNRVVVIFDEGHRSIAGKMGTRIVEYFKQLQMFGFTGTPIFAKQADKSTYHNQTKDQFGDQLAEYNIRHAINDQSILPFKIQYYDNKDHGFDLYQVKDDVTKNNIRKTSGFIRAIAQNIIDTIYNLTDGGNFNAMVAVDSVESAQNLYNYLKLIIENQEEIIDFKEQEFFKNFKMAVVFSIGANGEDESELKDKTIREWYEERMSDFAKQYEGTEQEISFDIKNQNEKKRYVLEVANRVKNNDVNLLIVCSMFLTGFDAKCLNTLYLSKDQQAHNLIQSFARTNRKYNAAKEYGNIVYYFGDQELVDDALSTYSGDGKYEIAKSYESIKEEYEQIAHEFKNKYGDNTNDVLNINDTDVLEEFLKEFRQILRLNKLLRSYKEYKKGDEPLSDQYINNYTSVYKIIHRKLKNKEKNDENYQLEFDPLFELTQTSIIDLKYITKLHKNKSNYNQEDIINKLNALNITDAIKELLKQYVLSDSDKTCEEYIEEQMYNEIKQLANSFEMDVNKLIDIVKTQYIEPPLSQIRNYLEKNNYTLIKRNKMAKEITQELTEIMCKYADIRGKDE